MEQTGDCRATQFLIQKISIDVQRGNAVAVMATPQNVDEFTCDDFVIAALTIFWLY